jgi:small conductance mechanosensitive channel
MADEKQHIPVRHQLRERLFEALRSAGVDMPFQTLTVRSAGEPAMRPGLQAESPLS